jgi:hypothetical protein
MVAQDKIDRGLINVLEKTQMEFKPSCIGNITCQKKPVKLQSRKFLNKSNCLLVPQKFQMDISQPGVAYFLLLSISLLVLFVAFLP